MMFNDRATKCCTIPLYATHVTRTTTSSICLLSHVENAAPVRGATPLAVDVFHANQAPPPPKADIHLQTDRV